MGDESDSGRREVPRRLEEVVMFELVPIDRDATTRVAVASFLAPYREPTLTAYLPG